LAWHPSDRLSAAEAYEPFALAQSVASTAPAHLHETWDPHGVLSNEYDAASDSWGSEKEVLDDASVSDDKVDDGSPSQQHNSEIDIFEGLLPLGEDPCFTS
jgi:hypothetical protein